MERFNHRGSWSAVNAGLPTADVGALAINPLAPTTLYAGTRYDGAFNGGQTPTFGIFVTGTGTVSFDPANKRVFARFKDGDGVTRGATSVAVRTQ